MGTNKTKQMKRKAAQLRLKERRLKQAGAILDRGVENMRAVDAAREAALREREWDGYVRGCEDVQLVVAESKTIAGARKAVAAFLKGVHEEESN